MTDSSQPDPSKPEAKPSFFAELRRRKVVRVAVTYVIVSWIIIQVAVATFAGFGIPEWAFRFVVIMLLLGFPIALILAWAFELTPDGIKTTKSAREIESPESHDKKRNWMSFGFGALLPTVIFGALAGYFYFNKSAPAGDSGELSKSIAVLPFINMSDEEGSAYFTSGIHEDILTKLALIHEFQVVSRTSVMQYRETNKSLKEIALELGVAYILEGSVQRAGNRVRVTGQLIKAEDDTHVWAQNFDRDLTNIFAIQSEIATEIAKALSTVLSPAEQELVDLRPTDNVAAYDAFTKARQILQTGFQRNFGDLEPLLKTAVLLDPNFSQAWAELGSVYARRYFDYWDHTQECLDKAKHAIDKAVALTPNDPYVIQKLGDYYYYGYRDYDRASLQYKQLTRDYPNFAPAFASLAFIQRRQGNWLNAMAELRRAVELEPRNRRFLNALGETADALKLYDEAISVFEESKAQANPNEYYVRILLARTQFHKDGSVSGLQNLLRELKQKKVLQFQINNISSLIGDIETQNEVLEELKMNENLSNFPWDGRAYISWKFWRNGDAEKALELAAAAVEQGLVEMETSPSNSGWSDLAFGYTVLGNKEEALRCAEAATAFLPESEDAWSGVEASLDEAVVLAWNGETDRAIDALARLLRTPNGTNKYALMHDLDYSILQDNERFKALLNEPDINKPLLR